MPKLHTAAYRGNLVEVRRLVDEAGYPVNSLDRVKKLTPIFEAARGWSTRVYAVS